MKTRPILTFIAGIGACLVFIGILGAQQAPGTRSGAEALADRDVYYPGSEDLQSDEMRVVACGTGMPTAPRFITLWRYRFSKLEKCPATLLAQWFLKPGPKDCY